jgi:hypothetical protein
MRFVTVKRATEIKLEGVKVSLDIVNGLQKGILLSDGKGGVLRVRLMGCSDLSIEVPAPPEVEKKHKLTGWVLGIPVDKTFDHQHEAQREQMKLEEAAPGTALLKVEEVQGPVDGESVGGDEIPF